MKVFAPGIFIAVLILGLHPPRANAQVSAGFHGGMNFANIDVMHSHDPGPEMRTCWLAGITVDAPLFDFLTLSVSPHYVVKGASAPDYVEFEPENVRYVRLTYLEVPIGLKFRLAHNRISPYFYLGGAVAFNLEAEEHYEVFGLSYNRDVRGDINDVDALIQAGVGFDHYFPSGVGIVTDIRYSRSLTPIVELDDVYTSDIMVTFGIMFR